MSRRSSSVWIVILVPLLGVALGFLLRTASRRADSAEPPTPSGLSSGAPLEFELADLDGGTVRADDLRGRVLLLDLWATWCGPCRMQADILAPLSEEYGGQVVFLGVNVAEEEAIVREHLAEEPLAYRVVLDPADSVGSQLGVEFLPTIVLVGPEGRVRFFRQGLTGAPQLRRELAKLGVTAT